MSNAAVLTVLRVFALLTALLSIVQALRGFGWIPLEWAWHGHLGNATFVTALVAAVFAFLWSRRSGNKGIFMHAASMAVLALVQVGLGEMGLRSVHMAVGVLFLVGAVALATLSYRKPGTAVDARETAAVDR